jgi:hypothetical protein
MVIGWDGEETDVIWPGIVVSRVNSNPTLSVPMFDEPVSELEP